jgi:hypothetical protein
VANGFKPREQAGQGAYERHNQFKDQFLPQKYRNAGNPVSSMTKAVGKRIGGALRAEQARQQKRRDSR